MITIRLQGLSKSYNDRMIFRDIDLPKTGGIIGISGPNGSGKSTLLRCLAFLMKPLRGEITYFRNEDELSTEDVRQTTGYLAPYINLYEELTVLENARFINELTNTRMPEGELIELLKDLQLGALIRKPFGKLSTGQQQRSKLAISLIRRPEILFLDEPGSNLDRSGLELLDRILEKYDDSGALIFLASNDERELKRCTDRIDLNNFITT